MSCFTEIASAPVSPASNGRSHRGSVLVAVLAILFFATILIFRFVEETVRELHYRGHVQEDPELRLTAYAAFEVVLAVLHEFRAIDGKLVAPAQGWSDPFAYAGYEPPEGYQVDVWFRDETGKIALASLNEDRLPLLFQEMGFDFSQSQRLTDTLLDWIDEDDLVRLNGAESDTYLNLDPPYRAANRPIRSWEELRLIEGFRDLFFEADGSANDAYRQFTGAVSFHHRQNVNLNTAGSLALSYVSRIEGFDPRLLADYLAGTDRVPGTADDNLLFHSDSGYYFPPENSDQRVGGIETGLLNIKVWCRRGATEFLLDGLVRVSGTPRGDSGLPFVIVSLSENQRID